jgi:hypothetical protein
MMLGGNPKDAAAAGQAAVVVNSTRAPPNASMKNARDY